MEQEYNNQLQKVSLDNLPNQSPMTQTLNEISVYKGALTQNCVQEQTTKILQAFPKMPIEMFNLLKERFKANKFSDQRLKDSVGHVIDTYEGWDKLPNIANFISFDKKIKIFTYNEACIFGMSSLKSIDIGLDTPRWALEEDVKRYGINQWVPKKIEHPSVAPELSKTENEEILKASAKIFKIIPEKIKEVERKKFTKKEQEERLERFKKIHGVN